MRVVIQRAQSARVDIGGQKKSEIGRGLLILLGVAHGDTVADVDYLCSKIAKLRIFEDEKSAMNLDQSQASAELMVVSQFTLYANTHKGNRPSFIEAAPPGLAIELYENFLLTLGQMTQKTIQSGTFGADMQISLVNDGPVTIIIDSPTRQ